MPTMTENEKRLFSRAETLRRALIRAETELRYGNLNRAKQVIADALTEDH